MVSWQVPHLSKCSRPDFNDDLGGDSNSGPVLASWRLFECDWNIGSSLGHFNLVSDEVYICSGLLFMISWWLLYLAKGPMPDFNNGPGNDLNSSCSLTPQRLFETDLKNDPSPSHSQPCVRWRIHLFRSPTLQVPYLSKGHMPDFSNGLGGDSNSGLGLALSFYLSPGRIMALPGHEKMTSVCFVLLWSKKCKQNHAPF